MNIKDWRSHKYIYIYLEKALFIALRERILKIFHFKIENLVSSGHILFISSHVTPKFYFNIKVCLDCSV